MKKFVLSILIVSSPWCQAQPAFTAHEWGTFTSVQGGDGKLLSWRPLQTSELPGFVYNRKKPGLNRLSTGFCIGKGEMVTLQRMETPVIYFYSGDKMTVDVNVAFPQGMITEWYPQASQFGPSIPVDKNLPSDAALLESRAVWKGLSIAPSGSSTKALPMDSSGSHYFAARQTGADVVQMNVSGAAESEKFIFYRGAGSFETPLRTSVDTNNVVVVENTGWEKLSHLFLVSIHDGNGSFKEINDLGSHDSAQDAIEAKLPLPKFQSEIGTQVQSALVSEGLFSDEARAMVDTWKDSWFTEEGERVLYILPREWTDKILPIQFTPVPKKLVRVMVGRAEIISPKTEMTLRESLVKANSGDAAARALAADELQKLGRFAGSALQLVNLHAKPANLWNVGYQILSEQAKKKS